MKVRASLVVVVGAALAGGLISGSIVRPVAAQTPVTVWDGIYTDEQALRGKKLYIDSCSSCHKEGLQGADLAPALKGDDFVFRWADSPVKDIFDTISMKMPQDNPGSLMPQVNADILAFIFQVNKFPAGHDELKADAAALKAITITPTKP